MLESAYIFRNPNEAIGLYDQLLFGIFSIKGVPILLQVLIYPLASLCVALIALHLRQKKPALQRGFEALAIVIFSLFCILIYQPWDEGYVNLLHSKNFAENGLFSFSKLSPVEGLVDFLPYFIFGLIGKTGIDLSFVLLLQGILGGVLCLYLLKRLWKGTVLADYALPLGILYLPLLFNSSSGFTTPWFVAGLLLFLQKYFYERKKASGLFWLALLPLIRPEAVWFVFLIGAMVWFEEGIKPTLKLFVTASIPFAILCVFRKAYYGEFVSTPIVYKSCLGNIFYLIIGIRNFCADLVASHTMSLLAVYLVFRTRINAFQLEDKIIGILIFFCIPYYISGGDWFPHAWARYLFPLSFVLFAIAIPTMAEWYQRAENSSKIILLSMIAFIFFLDLSASFGGWNRLVNLSLVPRKIIAEMRGPEGSAPYRVHYLSQVGYHFKNTTLATDRIGSTELASIHYFSGREAVDFMGITNREVAKLPIRDLPSLWRKAPDENELPFLIFKRLDPKLVAKYHPEYLYPFDFMMKRYVGELPSDEWTDKVVLKSLKRWSKRFKGLMTPLYGGVENLISQGYRPFVVIYKGKFSALYFVSESSLESHLNLLKNSGFEGGWKIAEKDKD